MTLVPVLGLGIAVLVVGYVLLCRGSDRVDRGFTGLAIALFGEYVVGRARPKRRRALQGAGVTVSYREYAARTVAFVLLAATAGAGLGLSVAWGVRAVVGLDPETIEAALPPFLHALGAVGTLPQPSGLALVPVVVGGTLLGAIVVGGATFAVRGWYPRYVADERARQIEATLPETIAFLYALSQSGMSLPEVIDVVADNETVYGAAAAEFSITIQAMDTFGMDVISALQTTRERTPSDELASFLEGLVSVLQSGHSLSDFLERRYEQAQDDAEAQQEATLEDLSTLAESYVTVLIAGPLFLITLLVVIGISIQETQVPLAVVVYALVPLGNLGFIVFLSTLTGVKASDRPIDVDAPSLSPSVDSAGDDGAPLTDRSRRNLRTIRIHRFGIRWIARLRSPVRSLTDRPLRSLFLTGPIGVGLVFASATGRVPVTVETAVAIAAVVGFGVLAVFFERRRRWRVAVEREIPSMLDRLASVNEAGMSPVTAVGHVRESDLGPLKRELDIVWNDVQLGSDLDGAFRRLGARLRTRSTSRIVALLTESMRASGRLGGVLRVAARQAAADRRLARARAQGMREYLVVVYVAFFVFLLIIVILAAYLFPNLPTDVGDTTAEADTFAAIGDVDADAYTTLFFHATLIQGVLSGLVAGQLSTGRVQAGAKHAAVLVALSVVVFAVMV